MTDSYESSRPLQVFRDEVRHLGVARYLCTVDPSTQTFAPSVPFKDVRGEEDLFKRYLSVSAAASSNGNTTATPTASSSSSAASGWIQQAFPLAGEQGATSHPWCGLVGGGTPSLALTPEQIAAAVAAAAETAVSSSSLGKSLSSSPSVSSTATQLQQYFLNHLHMWNGALVRVLITKNKYDALVRCNPTLSGLLPPPVPVSGEDDGSGAPQQSPLPPPANGGGGVKIYRVGMVRRVSVVAGKDDISSPSFPPQSLSRFVLDCLIPMLRFTIDFGDCSDEQYLAKYMSNDTFTEAEFDVFKNARGRGSSSSPRGGGGGGGARGSVSAAAGVSWLSSDEASTVRVKLVQGRLTAATTYPLTTDCSPDMDPAGAFLEHQDSCAKFYPAGPLRQIYLGSPLCAFVQRTTATPTHYHAEKEDVATNKSDGRQMTAFDFAFKLLLASTKSDVCISKPIGGGSSSSSAIGGASFNGSATTNNTSNSGSSESLMKIASVSEKLVKWCELEAKRDITSGSAESSASSGADGIVEEMSRSKMGETITRLTSILKNVVGPQIELLEQQVSSANADKAILHQQHEEQEEELLRLDRALRQKVDTLEGDKRSLQQTLLLRQQECATMTTKLTQLEKNSKTLVVAYKDVDVKMKKYKGLSDEVVALLGMHVDATPAEVMEMLKRRLVK